LDKKFAALGVIIVIVQGLQTTAREPNPAGEDIFSTMKKAIFTKNLLIC